ncbi:hypothetical protein LUZ60_000479 [Juncus effusus]|nr:hypothetical protein LUZ60_000479 [Juncus effusus]
MDTLSFKPYFRVSSPYLLHAKPISSSKKLRLRASPLKNPKLRTQNTQSRLNSLPPLYFVISLFQSFPKLQRLIHGGFDVPEAKPQFKCHAGGISTILMSTTAAFVSKSPLLQRLAANPTFMSGLIAWAVAQTIKVFLNFFVERKWDWGILFSSGGMPSSHSALCTALSASVAFCHGVSDALFPVCLGFSLIVMYDAIGVRRHAGMQAEVLNKIVEDLFQGHPISERKLKELLGHTPSQVFAGAILGILVAYFCCQGCIVPI